MTSERPAPGPPTVPVTVAVDAVSEILDRRIGASERVLTAETPLAELDLESVDYVEIFLAMEDRLGWQIDTAEAYEFGIVGDLAGVQLVRPLASGNR